MWLFEGLKTAGGVLCQIKLHEISNKGGKDQNVFSQHQRNPGGNENTERRSHSKQNIPDRRAYSCVVTDKSRLHIARIMLHIRVFSGVFSYSLVS